MKLKLSRYGADQDAARGYQDNISKAEQQGRKPDAYNKRELNKLATDPEAWVKGEIKYLTQTVESNKKNNIDSKVEETKLARANALLAQIKAEKKAMEQAALAPAEEAAPVAPEAEVVPAETVTAPEVTKPAVTAPAAPAASDAEMDANIEEGQRKSGFVYESPLESLTEDARSIIQSVGKNRFITLAPVRELFAELYDAYRIFAKQKNSTARNLTTAQIDEGVADFEKTLGLLGDYISKRDSGEFVREYTGRKQQEEQSAEEELPFATETTPVTEEVPVAEETIPVAPETEEDYSFLEETELTPEERDALLAQEETAPVAPVQVLRPKLPEIQVPKPEGFAPFLRKLGYTDEEISKMTFEQQQEIATNKTEPARAEGSSKVDVAKENQRVEKVAEAQRKIDENALVVGSRIHFALNIKAEAYWSMVMMYHNVCDSIRSPESSTEGKASNENSSYKVKIDNSLKLKPVMDEIRRLAEDLFKKNEIAEADFNAGKIESDFGEGALEEALREVNNESSNSKGKAKEKEEA